MKLKIKEWHLVSVESEIDLNHEDLQVISDECEDWDMSDVIYHLRKVPVYKVKVSNSYGEEVRTIDLGKDEQFENSKLFGWIYQLDDKYIDSVHIQHVTKDIHSEFEKMMGDIKVEDAKSIIRDYKLSKIID